MPAQSTQGASGAVGRVVRQPAYRSDDPSDPFNGQAELSVEQLVAEVQARNPSLQAASAAWRAAAERYPQVVSLDDPMFTYMISPSGVGMDNGGGWMVQASQKIPWAGKRALRGSAASAEADAMQGRHRRCPAAAGGSGQDGLLRLLPGPAGDGSERLDPPAS